MIYHTLCFLKKPQYCVKYRPMEDSECFIRIGKNINRIRKDRGYTIKELGYRCEMEKSNLIPIEKGRINITISTLLKICKALNIELKDLIN